MLFLCGIFSVHQGFSVPAVFDDWPVGADEPFGHAIPGFNWPLGDYNPAILAEDHPTADGG